MAHLIGLESIRIMVGSRVLLDDITLGIEDGTRVGVLGPNGAGKSTLLAAMAGAREVDAGRVTRAGGTRVAMLSQTDDFAPGATVRTAVHGDAPEHTWASDPAVRDIHAGLLADLDLDAPVATLSGGQRRRVALAGLDPQMARLRGLRVDEETPAASSVVLTPRQLDVLAGLAADPHVPGGASARGFVYDVADGSLTEVERG